jgi:hypothetical protein
MIYMAIRRIPPDGEMDSLDYPDESTVANSKEGCQGLIDLQAQRTPKWNKRTPVLRIAQFKVNEIHPGDFEFLNEGDD